MLSISGAALRNGNTRNKPIRMPFQHVLPFCAPFSKTPSRCVHMTFAVNPKLSFLQQTSDNFLAQPACLCCVHITFWGTIWLMPTSIWHVMLAKCHMDAQTANLGAVIICVGVCACVHACVQLRVCVCLCVCVVSATKIPAIGPELSSRKRLRWHLKTSGSRCQSIWVFIRRFACISPLYKEHLGGDRFCMQTP